MGVAAAMVSVCRVGVVCTVWAGFSLALSLFCGWTRRGCAQRTSQSMQSCCGQRTAVRRCCLCRGEGGPACYPPSPLASLVLQSDDLYGLRCTAGPGPEAPRHRPALAVAADQPRPLPGPRVRPHCCRGGVPRPAAPAVPRAAGGRCVPGTAWYCNTARPHCAPPPQARARARAGAPCSVVGGHGCHRCPSAPLRLALLCCAQPAPRSFCRGTRRTPTCST
jgi:hypothetical protein